MNKKIKLIYLILIVALNFSCVEKKAPEKETNIPERVATVKTDTLKFTSGVRAILQDSKGNYWIGSHNEGVSFYNGTVFEYFTVTEGLANNQIRSVQEDKKGNIWFGTANGISVYNNGTFTNYLSKNNNPIFDWNTTNGDLWFYAWEEDGINRFDGTNMNYLIFPKPHIKNTGIADNTYGVTDISTDKHGTMWIATYAALFNYDGKEVTIFDKEKLNLKHNERLHIRNVLADSKGRIWIGNNGIGVLLMEGNSTINFSKKHHLIHPTSKRNGTKSESGTLEHPFAIEEDAQGNIWFGDIYAGAWKYDGKTLTNYLISNKQPHPMIWTIYKDNNLLFGLADGNIFKFNGKAFERQF
ncbi:diguanylate cyclase [Flavobacterium sp. xlx-214]|nr:diguanylate cyclase [Flavobacterium sp. xlx-221]QMI84980.1 diguanylate cyclase [Flavobacterium sp. xlx-214]